MSSDIKLASTPAVTRDNNCNREKSWLMVLRFQSIYDRPFSFGPAVGVAHEGKAKLFTSFMGNKKSGTGVPLCLRVCS